MAKTKKKRGPFSRWWRKMKGLAVQEVGGSLLVALFGSAAVKQWVTGVTTLGAVIVGLLMLTCGLVLTNQYRQIRADNQRRLAASRTPEEIEDQIWAWAKRFQFNIMNAPEEEEHDFGLVLERKGRSIVISKAKSQSWLVLQSAVRATPYVPVPGPELDVFKADLAINLAAVGCNFEIPSAASPDAGFILVNQALLFDESMNEVRFILEGLGVVDRGVTVVSAAINRSVAQKRLPPPEGKGK